MFYQWLYGFADVLPAMNVFRYVTVRTSAAFFTAFLLCCILGPRFIRRMQKKQVRQAVRHDWPRSNVEAKKNTVTMGGLLILASLVVPAVLWLDIQNPFVLTALAITFLFSAIGYADDAAKLLQKNTRGVSMRVRLLLEFAAAGCALWALYGAGYLSTELPLPFFKNTSFDLGPWYILFGALVIVSSANAVNLTDGLDGLAIVPVMVCAGTLALFAYVAGHAEISQYLLVPSVPGAAELVPLGAAVVAACLGFLWFNAYPATVFMGDIGSLGLGAFLGAMAVLTKNELLMILLGGVFVVEAGSSLIQIVFFKLTGGRRILPVAPLHHYFEMRGVAENKIVVRFWIVSILLAVLSLSALKLR